MGIGPNPQSPIFKFLNIFYYKSIIFNKFSNILNLITPKNAELTIDDYIKFIISHPKDESKIQESKMNQVKMELELDLLSQILFENLYNNSLFYYKLYQKKNIKTDEQKYFFKEILSILEIIYDSNPITFINCDLTKAVLIHPVNSLKTPTTVNPEIVIKIFLDFKAIFPI